MHIGSHTQQKQKKNLILSISLQWNLPLKQPPFLSLIWAIVVSTLKKDRMAIWWQMFNIVYRHLKTVSSLTFIWIVF